MMKGYKQITLVKQDYDVFPNHTLEEVLQHPIPVDTREAISELLCVERQEFEEIFGTDYRNRLSGE